MGPRILIVPAVALSLLLAGCGQDRDAPSDSETPDTAAPFRVVVIGDSIPYNASADCPGCTAFADSYGTALERKLRRQVNVENLSRHDGAKTQDIEEQLGSGDLKEPLSHADVVIVSVGFNDQPPYFEPEQPCAATTDTEEQAIRAVQVTSRSCVDEATMALRALLVSVLTQVRDQASNAAMATLVPYNSWTGWSALDELPKRQRNRIDATVTYGLDQWRTVLCAESRTVNATCIDTYRRFNGSKGRNAADKLLADDHTHPSQQGNDVIRDLLLEAKLTD
ncbi:MAG: hydrolase family protein [Marmoricola sp.]|nr:hydrolase family protein [Marmoricola sp.]